MTLLVIEIQHGVEGVIVQCRFRGLRWPVER